MQLSEFSITSFSILVPSAKGSPILGTTSALIGLKPKEWTE